VYNLYELWATQHGLQSLLARPMQDERLY